MGDLNRAHTFADGDSVTAAVLNNMQDALTIKNSSLTTAMYQDASITGAKLSGSLGLSLGQISITSNKLMGGNGSNVGSEITVGSTLVLSASTLDLADNSVSSAKLQSNSVTTAAVQDGAVTLAKMASMTDARLLGRSNGSAGTPREISIGTGLSLAAGVLSGTSSFVVRFAQLTAVQSLSTAGAWVDVTSLSITLTPLSSSSKFLLLAFVNGSCSNVDTGVHLRFYRSGAIGVGDAGSSRTQCGAAIGLGSNDTVSAHSAALMHYDSPATGASITYKVQANTGTGGGYINRSYLDADTNNNSRASSSLCVIEIP